MKKGDLALCLTSNGYFLCFPFRNFYHSFQLAPNAKVPRIRIEAMTDGVSTPPDGGGSQTLQNPPSSPEIPIPATPTSEDPNPAEPEPTQESSRSFRSDTPAPTPDASIRISPPRTIVTTNGNERPIALVGFPSSGSPHASIPFMVFPAAAAQQRVYQRSRISQWCEDFCRKVCLVLTYQGMILVSIVGFVVVLIFCVLPTMLCTGMVICFYYCTNPDPLPLSVLIRDLFTGDPRGHTNFFSGNSPVDHAERDSANRALYRTKLIVRKLLAVERVPSSSSSSRILPQDGGGEDNGRVKIIDQRSSIPVAEQGPSNSSTIDKACKRLIDHAHIRNHNFPIEIWTDHKSLKFSAPLEAPAEDNDDEDKKNQKAKESRTLPSGDDNDTSDAPEFVPHYHRSAEIELSSRNIRGGSPTRGSSVPSTEDGRTSGDSNVAASCIKLGDASESQADACSDDGSVANEGGNEDNNGAEKCTPCPSTDYFGIEEDSRDPGTACDICILEFEVGDEIAWSPNLHCSHAFHKDCILDW